MGLDDPARARGHPWSKGGLRRDDPQRYAGVRRATGSGGVMPLSARNQLKGTVKSVKIGTVMAEIVIDVGGHELVSAITAGSAERLALAEGQEVTAIIKATEVLLSTDA